MNWQQLLSLQRAGDKKVRLRKDQDETRLGFEVDYDRVIFSSAFRSLQDKTQVIPLSKTDFVHTRLTHSLEVSVVGRSLGRIVGKKILEKYPELAKTYGYQFNDFGAIVAAAALAHDIGNPPFGHSGEKAIGEYFKTGNGKRFKEQLSEKEYHDLTHFEGNANGFKLLTETRNGTKDGLRLSYATLGAFTKYPKESLPHKPSKKIGDKKFGYFQSEKNIFEDVAKELGLLSTGNDDDVHFKRHPLTFLVEAADDICYTIIDFEDGINLGLIEEEFALEYLIKLVKDTIDIEKYHALTTKNSRLSYLRSLAINTLIQEATRVFIENEEEILSGGFSFSLLERSNFTAQIEDILSISRNKIYQSNEVMEKEIAGYKIISTLLEVYTVAVQNYKNHEATNYDKLIINSLLTENEFENKSTYEWLISLSSQVASLTDGNALRIYRKLSGFDSY
ncbi:deoxyguanosinetriphosphate triphosphohydrolase [Mesonia aquimarina]|uniref:deoxyguanosinetriphosphate triphosphohydrolase n=1 Tax=Mesonia aquimarina TaxID=1504967 RepID=UPI000EF59F90|nr:deoxyguanosinetriphosphate triphosphohydrolase [Mesonia aquimarina]